MKGRSVLSSEFQVSPETIRRAMAILADMKVVKVTAGSGILVLSRDQAILFVQNYRRTTTIQDMRHELTDYFDQSFKLQNQIHELTDQLLENLQYRRGDLIIPVEIAVPENSTKIGKSIGECQVWHRTGATIIGIIKKREIIVSPGPYYEFALSDRLLIVGDENIAERMKSFLV